MNLRRRHEMELVVTLPDALEKMVQVASAAIGLSSREYVYASLTAALATHAEHDPIVAAAFKYLQ
jgi:hypothetical protein